MVAPKRLSSMAQLGLLVIGLGLILTTVVAVSRYLLLDIDGTIVQSGQECERPLNNRCIIAITMKFADGSTAKMYPSEFPTEQLQTGFTLTKHSFALSYLLNSQVRHWEYASTYLLRVIVGIVCLLIWFPNRRRTFGVQ